MKHICIYNIGVGNPDLLMAKINVWQKLGAKITMVCPDFIVKDYKTKATDISFVPIPFCSLQSSKLLLIPELLKRTIVAAFYSVRFSKGTTTLYSISSVLESLLLPFFIKLFKPQVRWTALFENEVSLKREGSYLIRVLAFVFYKLSFLLLKKADVIFVIQPELKTVLVKHGVLKDRIVLTGNAIDNQLIKRAVKQKKVQYEPSAD